MVGTGALAGGKIGTAIGAAFGGVGAVPGALIGAGIGGLGALLGGDKLGEWLSDLTDDFPATKESITNFFTVTLPEKWNSFWSSVGGFFSETVPYALGYATGKVYTFFTETIPEKWDALWTALGNFFTETIPNWVSSLWNDHIVPFWTETLPGFFPQLWDSITGFFTEELPAIGSAIWGAISSFFTVTIPGWAKSAMDSVSSWWGGVKESFGAGFDAGSGKKARGGIVGGSSALESFARGGVAGFSDGGIVRGGSKLIEVAEEGSPEMIIPLSSQRRDRAMQLWMKAGQMLGVDNYFRGGRSDGSADEQARLQYYGAGGNAGGKSVQVDVGGISIDVHVDAADSQSVAEVIKEKLAEAADDIAGIFADAFGAQFENTPVRGGT